MPVSHLDARRCGKIKGDEFYTLLPSIEAELAHYPDLFRNKIVYSNCDRAESQFVKYFSEANLGLKDYIYSSNDFRSDESIKKLNQCDIVVTNPPFSLFVEYYKTLLKTGKKFIIVSPLMGVVNFSTLEQLLIGEVFPGRTKLNKFLRPDGSIAPVSCRWIQNIKRHYNPPLNLHTSNPEVPPNGWHKFLNYDAYNLDKSKYVADFYTTHPNYQGRIGVPVTFVDWWNPDQFKFLCRSDGVIVKQQDGSIKQVFCRLIISTNQTIKPFDDLSAGLQYSREVCQRYNKGKFRPCGPLILQN